MCYAYVIKSTKSGRYYIGSTRDLKERLKQHNDNKTRSLRNQGPFELICAENYSTFREVRQREAQIKKYKGGRAFKKLIESKKIGPVV